MPIMLGQILVAQLQTRGIHTDNYQKISLPTYDALDEIEKTLEEGSLVNFLMAQL